MTRYAPLKSSEAGDIVLYKKDGKVVYSTSSVISDDGKTMTSTVKVPDGKGSEITIISVYDRQRSSAKFAVASFTRTHGDVAKGQSRVRS